MLIKKKPSQFVPIISGARVAIYFMMSLYKRI